MKYSKKLYIIFCLLFCLSFIICGCSSSNRVYNEVYGTYKYQADNGNEQIIVVEKDNIRFEGLDLEKIKEKKAAINFAKKKSELEQEGKSLSEEESEKLIKEYTKNINLNNFLNSSFCEYKSDYSEDTQEVYIETVTKNAEELFLVYNLKKKTITLYDTIFERQE